MNNFLLYFQGLERKTSTAVDFYGDARFSSKLTSFLFLCFLYYKRVIYALEIINKTKIKLHYNFEA